MPLTADAIRLRAPVPKEVFERLKNRPVLLKGAQLAQPALVPGHPLPLHVDFWDDTPDHVVSAGLRAINVWNERMLEEVGVAPFTDLGSARIDIMIGVRPFDIPFDPVAEFGRLATGVFLGRHTFGRPFGTYNAELGDIEHVWDSGHRVYRDYLASRIFVPDDIKDVPVLRALLAHELGHALLLGHDPHTAWRLMYRHFGAVVGPMPKECQWAAGIWV